MAEFRMPRNSVGSAPSAPRRASRHQALFEALADASATASSGPLEALSVADDHLVVLLGSDAARPRLVARIEVPDRPTGDARLFARIVRPGQDPLPRGNWSLRCAVSREPGKMAAALSKYLAARSASGGASS